MYVFCIFQKVILGENMRQLTRCNASGDREQGCSSVF